MSPMFGQTAELRGTRGSHLPYPRPQWPTTSPTPMINPQPYRSTQSPYRAVQSPYRSAPSPLTVGFAGPKPYRAPSFSPVAMYSSSSAAQPEYLYSSGPPLQPPSPAFELAPRYEYIGVPLEPPHPQSYVIYDDDEFNQGPSTREIIANQSQDYVDEKLAEYQLTIAQLQGEKKTIKI